MISARRSLTAGLTLLAALAVAPARARAQAPSPGAGTSRETDAPARAGLLAERQRVRADLERVNAEIDTLKRAGRGLRDDYRLRARLADAEALARRLTALDTRLGAGVGPLPSWPAASTEPRALPTDGPAELDAKADILNDQARRLAARGDALLGRAHDLRARQNLRRRVGQMERDPFSPLEGSKRRTMASGAAPAGDVPRGPPQGGNGTMGVSDTKGAGPTGSTSPPFTAPAAPVPLPGGSPPPSVPTVTGAAPGATAPGQPTTSTAVPGSSAVSSPQSVPTPTGTATESVALSVQLRGLLDPMTLAELQRLETTGTATTNTEALERAGAALKARAERLGQQAAALRARAH